MKRSTCRRATGGRANTAVTIAAASIGLLAVAGTWAAEPVARPHAEQQELTSADGRRAYRLFIAAPEGAAPVDGYPVIYVMDGNDSFGTVADTARRLAFESEQTGYAPAIVVAIGYPMDRPYDEIRRTFDLTPAAPRELLPPWDANRKEWPATGGADLMLDFIQNQVKPVIERRYPVDHRRETLIGHSFGGLFVLHALFTRPQAFDAYVAISPSIWYADRHVLKEAESFAGRLSRESIAARLLIAVGGCEQVVGQCDAALPRSTARDEFLTYARQVDNAKEMHARLAKLRSGGLTAELLVLEGEQHTTVVPAAIGRGVRFALRQPASQASSSASAAATAPVAAAARPQEPRWKISGDLRLRAQGDSLDRFRLYILVNA